MKKCRKEEPIILESVEGSVVFNLVPAENNTWENAYVRVISFEGYAGTFDNGDMRKLKKLHRWLSYIIEANK